MRVGTQPQAPPAVSEPLRDAREAGGFDRIACERCGWLFPAPEGAAMLFALKGPCPNCGGEFRLILGTA